MKKSHIAIFCVLIFIATIILVGVFCGHLLVRLGLQHPSSYGQPPAEDATLWEKAKWERLHGAIPTCGYPPFIIDGPISLISTKNFSISYIAFNLTLYEEAQGESQDLTNVTIMVSTAEKEKMVHIIDPSVNITWFRPKSDNQNNILKLHENVRIKIDVDRMGFTATDLGPHKKMSLIVSPSSPGCVKYEDTITILGEFEPGVVREKENY